MKLESNVQSREHDIHSEAQVSESVPVPTPLLSDNDKKAGV